MPVSDWRRNHYSKYLLAYEKQARALGVVPVADNGSDAVMDADDGDSQSIGEDVSAVPASNLQPAAQSLPAQEQRSASAPAQQVHDSAAGVADLLCGDEGQDMPSTVDSQ
jgi:hypothetical protein